MPILSQSKPILLARYKLFAKAYMGKALKNATQAAILAGYSPKTASQAGYDLLRTPDVRRFLRIEAERHARKMELTPELVLSELTKLGTANMQDYVDDTGKFVGMDAISRDRAAAIQELTIDTERRTDGRSSRKRKAGKNATEVTRVKVKLANKRDALELLGKHFNLFGDREGGSQTAVKVIVVNSPRPGSDQTMPAIDVQAEIKQLNAPAGSDTPDGTDPDWDGEGGPDVL